MNLRLLPWAALAAIVVVLAFRAPFPGKGSPAPAGARGLGGGGLEIRLWPVEMREFHDDGAWNLLVAREAVYSYGRNTVQGSEVAVSLGTGENLKGSVIRASKAFWDFKGRSITLPEGGHADREGGWKGDLTPAALDLDSRILKVPGAASVSGPGFSVEGKNLVWRWLDGKITMDSPVSSITPASLPGRKG